MPFLIVRDDITKMRVDAIVAAGNTALSGGGGVDGAIRKAAGPGLAAECESLGGCRVGEAKITGAYDLPCRYVIHTVGPKWHGGAFGEERALKACYRSSLELAAAHGCKSLAFPLISSGAYGCPKDKALRTAVSAISDFLLQNEMTVYIVLYGRESVDIGRRLAADIEEYIDDNYVELHKPRISRLDEPADLMLSPMPKTAEGKTAMLDDLLNDLDESFRQMLFRKIDESGMTDAQCYKRANIDRKLFSKIRKDPNYKPSKATAVAFAVALELSVPEAESLLGKAGYALSRSSKFDVIVRYFLERGNYNIFEINEVLFYYDQTLLGAC